MINKISDYNSYESHIDACSYSKAIEGYQSFVDNVCQLLRIKNTCESQLEITDELEERIYSRIKHIKRPDLFEEFSMYKWQKHRNGDK